MDLLFKSKKLHFLCLKGSFEARVKRLMRILIQECQTYISKGRFQFSIDLCSQRDDSHLSQNAKLRNKMTAYFIPEYLGPLSTE